MFKPNQECLQKAVCKDDEMFLSLTGKDNYAWPSLHFMYKPMKFTIFFYEGNINPAQNAQG